MANIKIEVNEKILQLRRDFIGERLVEKSILNNPIDQFKLWFNNAIDAEIKEANAMCLSTINNAMPSSRVVYLRGLEDNKLIFYTNYNSQKSRDIISNPNVSLNFFWYELHRQIRIQGIAKKTSKEQSDAYFASRPRESQLGAWASDQSNSLDSPKKLTENLDKFRKQFKGKVVSRPPHWGGWEIKPSYFEFWQGQPNRLHDRLAFTLEEDEQWVIKRLNP